MEKCHCAGIKFEAVVELCQEQKCHYREAAKKLDVSETCRACEEDLESYCENHLESQQLTS
jgi:hypothetical protein